MSNGNNQEPRYTEQDLQREVNHLKQLLWAVVRSAGGILAVPYALWVGAARDVELHFWEDAQKMSIMIEATESKHDNGAGS
jgi:hypothetical protein